MKPLSSLPRRRGRKVKKKKKKEKNLVSALAPTRRALCSASVPLFVINLHGVMFALAGAAAGQRLARWYCSRLLHRRTGRGRVLPAPGSTWTGDARSLVPGWLQEVKHSPRGFVVLGCWGMCFALKWRDFGAGVCLVAGVESSALSLRKSIPPWSNLMLAGRWSVRTNRSFPL